MVVILLVWVVLVVQVLPCQLKNKVRRALVVVQDY
jgi:hypothetical protein